MVKIYGKVTDFSGNPLEGAEINVCGDGFNLCYQTHSDKDGNYSLSVEEGSYIALAALKDYGDKNLEYWAWNILAFNDLEINPRIDGLEMYGMHAWRPHVPFSTFIIYFRPMSLKKGKVIRDQLGRLPNVADVKRIAPNRVKMGNVLDISPDLTKDDIRVEINGETVDVLEINRITEFAGEEQSIFAYLVQTDVPAHNTDLDYDKICVTVTDRETGEMGEGCFFCQKPHYVSNQQNNRAVVEGSVVVVTNNRKVAEKYPEQVVFVDGSVLDVFVRCQQLFAEGYDLVTHPMTGNVEVTKVPYKSVVMKKVDYRQDKSVELICSAIEKAKEARALNYPQSVLDDYAFLDLELIKEPLEELL